MSETARLIGMLQASKAQRDSSAHCAPDIEAAKRSTADYDTSSNTSTSIPCSLVDALELAIAGSSLPPKPTEPPSYNINVGLNRVFSALNRIISFTASSQEFVRGPTEIALDITNDLAVETSKRIFAASKNPLEIETIARDLGIPKIDNMAGRFPSLTTSNLPPASASEQSATASPARGTAMLNSIFKSVRVPEFRFRWQYWAEKGQQSAPSKDKSSSADDFASRPKPLGEQIISVKEFYQHFNNIPLDSLKLRDSIHLFHQGVKPLWEDPRNTRGGAYYFRVGKDVAPQFWHEICLLAVGDVLQGAVETKRDSFNDDICGISYSVRWNAVQVAVWNRDADNEVGKEKLLATILEKLSEEIQPKKDSYWYKAHKEHKGFIAPEA
ncbi:translation initiation factor eIF4e [Lophiostoma macrostomum CBS 122681]|uniref:Translation initiation factor eIF4e n=1 Tax=Lophiostoma macrostomum CBS 122681 TaxID=1314788 RepID=A0A6A6TJM8_9PLEO|nr:translation initiation factor eIF4e [Lophiostoma macrostomum CBS 122681]